MLNINERTICIFSPILVLTGILGFLIPPDMAILSGAIPYNFFHMFFGLVGVSIWIRRSPKEMAWFNIVFGLIDIYQAIASALALPPTELFAYTFADDVLHVIIGLALCIIGTMALKDTSNT
jgi:hypothetical protein